MYYLSMITKYCEDMNKLNRCVDSRSVAPFFGWGGGGGGEAERVKKIVNLFGALFAQIVYIIGGGQNDMFATPIFSLGATGHQDRRLW